jgi:hypothetical protein
LDRSSVTVNYHENHANTQNQTMSFNHLVTRATGAK